MKTSDFLDILEHRKLAPAVVLGKLRAKAEKDQHRVTPQAILKYLVKKEHIPRSVAYQLLKTTLTVSSNAESSIMGFVPLPETPLAGQETAGSVFEDDIETLAPVDSRQNLKINQIENQEAQSSHVSDEAPDIGEPASPHLSSLASLSSVAKAQDESEAAFDEMVPEPGKRKSVTKRQRKKKKNEWDSSLILYGGGGLLVLIISGLVIYYLLNRENADLVLQQASDYFESGSYTQAISQYEHFVEGFKGHPQFSAAKVKLGMARLWKDSSDNDFENALQTAQQVLDDIQDEPDFRSAQRDLASLVPKIAQGLASQAEAATDLEVAEQRVAQTRAALSLAMNTKYIPKEFRDEVLLDEIQQTLLRVERSRQQNLDLADTLAKIDKALASQDISVSYELHSQLLEKHPALMHDETLAAKVKAISEAEAQAIKFVLDERNAERGPRQSPIVASLTLADQQVITPSGVAGTLAVRISGAVYALQASDGKLLWREYLGDDPHTSPIKLDNGDYLVNDIVHHEIARLEGETGKVLWRLSFETQVMQPVVAGKMVYVAGLDGKLHVVELASGQCLGFIEFSQNLSVPPTVDDRRQLLYVPGVHSSLYTISTDDYSCLGVFYLGHSADSIVVPVAKILNKIIVAANTGISTCELSVVSTAEDGLPRVLDTEKRLTGTVDTPLLVEGRRLVVLTSLGQISAYEVSSAEGKEALSRIAERDPEGESSIAHFGLLQDGNVWVAGRELTKLAILPTGNRIQVRNLDNDFSGDVFDNSLQLIGSTVVHVRHPADQAGSVVAAIDAATGKTLWQTQLAVPLAGAPSVDPMGAQISAITASGAAYLLDRQAMSRRVQNQADHLSGRRSKLPAFTMSVDLGQGRLASGATGSARLLIFHPGAPRGPLELINLPAPVVAGMVAWQEGFVVPTQVGQVYFLSSEEGEQLGSPFQPPLEANQSIDWLTPAVVGTDEDSQLVITDGRDKIFLVQQVAEPEPHLEAVNEEFLSEVRLNTPLAVSGNVAIAGTEGGSVALFDLPALAARDPLDGGGQIAWGPFSTDNGFVFTTDAGELVCVHEDGEIAWKTSLGEKLPAGTPLTQAGTLTIAWQLHGVSRFNLADGKEQAHSALDQAVLAGPVPFGQRLVLAASDGTLLIVNQPTP